MRIIQSLKLFESKTFRTMSAFCQNRDIAIVSSKIIDMIQNQKKEDTKCLGLKITQLNIKDFPEKYQIKTQNLQIVKKMFTTGVQLPQYYRTQESIKRALKAGQGQKNKPKPLFVFYPTWITTTNVFKYMRQKTQLSLFTGDHGVGKTASFILYSMLMNNITKYAMSNKEAAIKLIKDEIIKSPQKVFYWSFQKYIQKGIIIDQCSQMFNDNVQYQRLLKLQKTNFNKLSKEISDFYRFDSPVQTVIIIDQINALAALYRQHNAKKKMNNFRGQEQIQSRQNLYSCNLIREKISKIAQYKIYNSSVNIQKSLICKKHIIKQEENMMLNSHAAIYYPKLEYQLRSSQQKAKNQTLHYIGMEYKRFFANFTESQIQQWMNDKKIQSIQSTKGSVKQPSKNASLILEHNQRQKLLNKKVQIIKNFIKPDIQFALPLLFIRQNLDIVARHQAKVFKKRIQDYYILKQQEFKYFIQKVANINQKEREKIMQILILMSNYVFELEKQKDLIIINRQNLFKQMSQRFSDIRDEEMIDKYMDQSTFPYSDQIQGYICIIPRKIMEPSLKQFTVSSLLQDVKHFKKRLQFDKNQSGVFIGLFLENYITKAILQCGQQKGIFKMQGIFREIAGHGKFLNLNLPQKTQNAESYLKGHMSQMIKLAENNKGEQDGFFLGLPYYKQKPQKRSFTSYFSDFCLVKYTKRSRLYEFIFVDIKTGNKVDFKDLNNKAEDFRQRVKLSLESQSIKYKIRVIILCKQKCKYPKIFPNIAVANINTIKFIILNQSFALITAKQVLNDLKLI